MGETLWPQLTLSIATGEEGRDIGETLWPLLTPSKVMGGEGRDGGETPRPLLTRPGGEGRDIGETLWPLLTPYRVKPQSPLEPIPNRQVREVRFPGLYVGPVRRAG